MRTLFVAACLFVAAFAQYDRGTIAGTVTDPVGAVVAGVAIEAKNASTGCVYPVATSGTGNYTISQLPVGTHEITATASGFKKTVRRGKEVQASSRFRVDFTLEVVATNESVTVTAEAPLLKTESGELSQNVSYDRAESLPVFTIGGDNTGAGNVRNPLAVVTLMPGAQFQNENTLRINGMPSTAPLRRLTSFNLCRFLEACIGITYIKLK